MGFLDNYEDVAARIKRLHATHPTNRVETRIVEFSAQHGYVLVECKIFKEYEDAQPSAIDFAFGRVESYNAQMKRWFVEDTVTSAIGRCAGLLLGSDTRQTKQNMEQVETMPTTFVNKIEDDPWSRPFAAEDGFTSAGQAVEQIQSQLGGEIQAESPICRHGHMVKRESKPDAAKEWAAFFCTEKLKQNQCDPIWLIRSATTGQWRMKKDGE
jgi:hypothetical protein